MERVPQLGSILTAIVTPFDDHDEVDETAFVELMAHLAHNGSEGFVVCGTTGEASTLTDEEHLRVVELAVTERPEGTTVVAGAGSNDTRHAVHMTERVCALGVDGVLSVNPYYNRPNRRGIIAHYTEIARAADRPIVLYNIPQRTASDMPNDLLAELAQLDHVEGVKQANNESLAPSTGWSCTPATTTSSPGRSTSAAPAASSSPATSSATRCAAWSTSPIARGDRRLAAESTPPWASRRADAVKAALNLGHRVGGLRLPSSRPTRTSAADPRDASSATAWSGRRMSRHTARPAARRPGRDRQEHDRRRVRRRDRRGGHRPALPDG